MFIAVIRGASIWHFADTQITDTQLQDIADKYTQSDIPGTNNVYCKCNTCILYYKIIENNDHVFMSIQCTNSTNNHLLTNF